jgi:hypothetical protein
VSTVPMLRQLLAPTDAGSNGDQTAGKRKATPDKA